MQGRIRSYVRRPTKYGSPKRRRSYHPKVPSSRPVVTFEDLKNYLVYDKYNIPAIIEEVNRAIEKRLEYTKPLVVQRSRSPSPKSKSPDYFPASPVHNSLSP
jgi:hypothetical protein